MRDLERVARRVIWFKKPDDVLEDPTQFLCHLMQWGTTDDVIVTQQYFSKSDFRNALDKASPGILDRQSWAYWNLVLNDDPERPMPSMS